MKALSIEDTLPRPLLLVLEQLNCFVIIKDAKAKKSLLEVVGLAEILEQLLWVLLVQR